MSNITNNQLGVLIEQGRAETKALFEHLKDVPARLTRVENSVEKLGARVDVLEIAVRKNSADIQDLKIAVGKNSTDIQDLKIAVGKNSADIQGLRQVVEDIDKKIDFHEDRLISVEAKIA